MALETRELGFHYPHKPLFKGLDFELKPGSALHIRGKNGAGKSTLLEVLAGLRSPKQGSILWKKKACEKKDLIGLSAFVPAEINGLYLQQNATANLAFWASVSGKPKTETELTNILTYWGLGHPLVRLGLAVGQFSTGMKRRLALARLTTSHTYIWLLDEPTSGLDNHGTQLLSDSLTRHLERGGCAIFTTHEGRLSNNVPHLDLS